MNPKGIGIKIAIVQSKINMLLMGLNGIEDESARYTKESVTEITEDIERIYADFNALYIKRI